jgi:hypothetical protein
VDRVKVIRWADEAVSIYDVLEEEFGLTVFRSSVRSPKGHCPFGWEHPDGGVEKSFRVYPQTNSAFCFAGHGRFGPVRLVALKHGVPLERAAVDLLVAKGLLGVSWRQRWRELLSEAGGGREAVPARDGFQELVDALHEALRRHPKYPQGGVSQRLSEAIVERLSILERLFEEGGATVSVEEVQGWFDESKDRLFALLEEG